MFVLQLIHSLATLDKTLTKNTIKKFKRFVRSKNQQGLTKSFKSKREYVRICKILARVPRVFTLGSELKCFPESLFRLEVSVTAIERSFCVDTKLVLIKFAIVGPSMTLVNVDTLQVGIHRALMTR